VLFAGQNMQRLLGGFLVTLRVAIIVLILGGILGVLLGALRTLHNRPLRIILRIYLEIFRIVPTVVLLFVAYYILPQTFGLNLPGEEVAVLVFTLWTAAEMSDIVRGALESVPVHQKESGLAIGLTQAQLFRYVLIPQAIPVALPGMISVMDIVNVGQTLVEANGHKNPSAAFWIYGMMFILYYILCAPLSQWAKRVEKKRLERANG
jgi:polar amino acid transport system permease protein